MKTIKQHLTELPEPYNSEALANIEPVEVGEAKRGNVHSALLDAFEWVDSPQGFNYWLELYAKLKEDESKTEGTILYDGIITTCCQLYIEEHPELK